MALQTTHFNIGDIFGGIALARDLFREFKKKDGSNVGEVFTAWQQRMPNLFGIGYADEQIFESLRQLMEKEPLDKRLLLDLVTGKMRDYEARIFRLVVAGMSPGNMVLRNRAAHGSGKQRKTTSTEDLKSREFTKEDLRVEFLNDVATEVLRLTPHYNGDQHAAAKEVVKRMRMRRLIARDPFAQKALELWADATEWVKTELLSFFHVENLSDITLELVGRQLNTLAQQIPGVPVGQVNSGFWASAFRRNPISATIMAGGIIVTIAFFAFV